MPELKKDAATKLNHLFDKKNYDLPQDEPEKPPIKNRSTPKTKKRGMDMDF